MPTTIEKSKRPGRLDAELVRRGLAPSRDKAQALIMAGQVFAAGQLADKADRRIAPDCALEVRAPFPYVSRGALKIERAISAFSLDVRGKHVLDIGISTGGFSDYLLQRGAAAITGIDVTIGQVADKLRRHPCVRLLEMNARFLRPEDIGQAPDLVVVDLSFISIRKILPALIAFGPLPVLALIKPQFEAQKGRVGKGGVVRRPERRREILLALAQAAAELGFAVLGAVAAGVTGKKGNQEYFFLLQHGSAAGLSQAELLARTVDG